MRFDFKQVKKALVAVLGVALMYAETVYVDNMYVRAAVALATALGVYGVRNSTPDSTTPV